MFQDFDSNRSGRLEPHEFYRLMQAFAFKSGLPPFQNRDIQAIMYRFDTNQDGLFDYDEFEMALRFMGQIRGGARGQQYYQQPYGMNQGQGKYKDYYKNKKKKKKKKKKKYKGIKMGKKFDDLFDSLFSDIF